MICSKCNKKINEDRQTHVISPRPLTKQETQYLHIHCYMIEHEQFMEEFRKAMMKRMISSPTNIMTDNNTCHEAQRPITAPAKEAIH